MLVERSLDVGVDFCNKLSFLVFGSEIVEPVSVRDLELSLWCNDAPKRAGSMG